MSGYERGKGQAGRVTTKRELQGLYRMCPAWGSRHAYRSLVGQAMPSDELNQQPKHGLVLRVRLAQTRS